MSSESFPIPEITLNTGAETQQLLESVIDTSNRIQVLKKGIGSLNKIRAEKDDEISEIKLHQQNIMDQMRSNNKELESLQAYLYEELHNLYPVLNPEDALLLYARINNIDDAEIDNLKKLIDDLNSRVEENLVAPVIIIDNLASSTDKTSLRIGEINGKICYMGSVYCAPEIAIPAIGRGFVVEGKLIEVDKTADTETGYRLKSRTFITNPEEITEFVSHFVDQNEKIDSDTKQIAVNASYFEFLETLNRFNFLNKKQIHKLQNDESLKTQAIEVFTKELKNLHNHYIEGTVFTFAKVAEFLFANDEEFTAKDAYIKVLSSLFGLNTSYARSLDLRDLNYYATSAQKAGLDISIGELAEGLVK